MLCRLAIVLVFFVVGCHAPHYSLRHELAKGQTAEIEVLGVHPRIQLENGGPEALYVQFIGPRAEIELRALPAKASSVQTLQGPVLVRLKAPKNSACKFTLVAFSADGLSANLLVESAP